MGKETACSAGDAGHMISIPGWGRAPGVMVFLQVHAQWLPW